MFSQSLSQASVVPVGWNHADFDNTLSVLMVTLITAVKSLKLTFTWSPCCSYCANAKADICAAATFAWIPVSLGHFRHFIGSKFYIQTQLDWRISVFPDRHCYSERVCLLMRALTKSTASQNHNSRAVESVIHVVALFSGEPLLPEYGVHAMIWSLTSWSQSRGSGLQKTKLKDRTGKD